jgi:ferredoxin-fold anticodon binding domain-containing protein
LWSNFINIDLLFTVTQCNLITQPKTGDKMQLRKLSIRVPVTEEEKAELKRNAMKFGYMNLSAFLRDKANGVLESDEIKTLKTKNKRLMQLIKDGE